ncbi:hypothetical protein JQ604_15805 [Bradyrhizobium jicamae]|uniref:hypothetical protein n=1 Tax=Bradyrhizobium jicamae TaxID=280332 RepID=UPI001BA6711E|nr:hypothetical protein [Bradyrhizobium jicamae]MBR0753654.1 hypothetical protein [Bradyrhizobium jicamae]
MPLARYFLFVGGALLALLFVIDAIVPQDNAALANLSSPGLDKSTVRIKSTQKLPERVVYDTTQPTIVPAQATVVAAATRPAVDQSATARVRDTFAQFVPAEAKDLGSKDVSKKDAAKVAEAKPLEVQQTPAQQAKPKKKVAKVHSNPPQQLQPTRLAQPQAQPFRVAQQQPRGFFGGFGWNSTW